MQIPATQINAAGGAMVQLYDNIASGAIASWDVTGISQAYNHLRMVFSGRGDNAAVSAFLIFQFNGDTGANYDDHSFYVFNNVVTQAGSVAATRIAATDFPANTATANMAGTIVCDIPNYKQTTFFKNASFKGGMQTSTTTASQEALSGYGQWRSTAAITQITVSPSAGNFIAGSRLTIYGLL